MEVSKHPLVSSYKGPKNMQYYSSFLSSSGLLDLKSRSNFIKMPERTCTSLVPSRKLLCVSQDQNSHSFLSEITGCRTWKSHVEFLRLPVTFRTLPEPFVTAKSDWKLFGIPNTTELREITEKLNFSHLQHISYLVSAVARSYETYMIENKIGNTPKTNCCANEKINSNQIKNCMKPEISPCDNNCESDTEESIGIRSVDIGSTVVEMLPEVKKELKDVNKEMISRKQRQISKHSKKRKRRMKKKNKTSTGCSVKKGCSDSLEEMQSSKLGQIKTEIQHPPTVNRTICHDYKESDEDLCIVFENETDGACSMLPESLKSQCTDIKEMSDLWIEFDSLPIVHGTGGMTVTNKSLKSDILFECDSDSEYETDCGNVYVNTSEFDSWSGLFFLNSSLVDCSTMQSVIHRPSFMPRTFSELSQVAGSVGTSEIFKINKKWEEMTYAVNGEPHVPQRVTFAAAEDLVVVFPVDMIDRKSEWEQLALERFRFKRRVEDFEELIAPYFTSTHRAEVYRRMEAATR